MAASEAQRARREEIFISIPSDPSTCLWPGFCCRRRKRIKLATTFQTAVPKGSKSDTPRRRDNRSMNPLLSRLQPYPFERLRQLFVGVKPNPAYRPISLGIGEPKHPTPEFIKQALI